MSKLVAFLGGGAVAGLGLLGATYIAPNGPLPDIMIDFNKSTDLAIEEQNLNARQVCAEFMKAQEAVIQEFTDRGVQLPTDTAMSLDECQLRVTIGSIIARP
jgi:hypothetical protein